MLRRLIRKWLGIEEIERKGKEVEEKVARSRPMTMNGRLRSFERRSFEMARAKGSPYADFIPPGVRPPE